MTSITRYRLYFIFLIIAFLTPFYIVLSKYQGDLSVNLKNEKFHKAENEQNRRKRLVDATCQFLKINQTLDDIPTSYLDHFIVDDTHKLIYCYVPKVKICFIRREEDSEESIGSQRAIKSIKSSLYQLEKNFLALRNSNSLDPLSIAGNETHQANVFRTLNQYSADQVKEKLRTYWKFVFARHPYERMLSAYRNKLEDSYVDYFRVRFGTEIIKKFRANPSKTSLEKGHDVLFHEFIQYITSLNVSEWKKAFNEHWRPVFDLCFPCHVKYDFIGKYETLEDDANYILEKTGLSKYVKFPDREKSYRKQPTKDVMQSYYRNISTQALRKLFEIYKEDFTLFEYELMYL